MSSVRPSSLSWTSGWPVHPVPDQVFGWFPTGDWPDIGLSGYRHSRSGADAGTGPVPKNVRVGFPLNIVSPLTEPHCWKTDSAVTTPCGLCASVVVVDSGGCVDAVAPAVSAVVSDERGGSVVTEFAGPTETTLPSPATHALASVAMASIKGMSFRIGASVGTDFQ
jgi:hypothetical protein